MNLGLDLLFDTFSLSILGHLITGLLDRNVMGKF